VVHPVLCFLDRVHHPLLHGAFEALAVRMDFAGTCAGCVSGGVVFINEAIDCPKTSKARCVQRVFY
jgi:hypothetical protein